jgi:hypothetical protein
MGAISDGVQRAAQVRAVLALARFVDRHPDAPLVDWSVSQVGSITAELTEVAGTRAEYGQGLGFYRAFCGIFQSDPDANATALSYGVMRTAGAWLTAEGEVIPHGDRRAEPEFDLAAHISVSAVIPTGWSESDD